jgi:hypothetical protein
MRGCGRQEMDHQNTRHDQADAEQREGIEPLPEQRPGDERDHGHARARPHRIGNRDRNGAQRQRQEIEGDAVAEKNDDGRQRLGEALRRRERRGGNDLRHDRDAEVKPAQGSTPF